MCHEPTSRGLPHSIGIGKGTVILDDFEQAQAIFLIGHNAGTNAPRMMTPLVEARKRGVPIRSEEHTSELQSLMRISYAVFCLKKKQTQYDNTNTATTNTHKK